LITSKVKESRRRMAVYMASSSANWANPRLKGRIVELDGLRKLAILLVLVCHYVAGASSAGLGTWQAYAFAPLRLTWSGVDLFFVLSGFLIGGILLDAKSSGTYYRSFYFRRFLRIFPIYYIWIGIFCVALYVVKPHGLGGVFNSEIPTWC